jgi:cytochrome c oxidase subunit 3
MLSSSARYYIPDPSRYPIFGSAALLSMALGAATWFNGVAWGKFLVFGGLLVLFYMIAGWFGTVAAESESGRYNKQVDTSFRWGMSWFIFSEVMFFAAFFGALFYMRVLSVPELGNLEHQELIWPASRGAGPLPVRELPITSPPWSRGVFPRSTRSYCSRPARP